MQTNVQDKFTNVPAMAAVYDPGAILESKVLLMITFTKVDRLITYFFIGEHAQDGLFKPARNLFCTHATFKSVMKGLHDVRVRLPTILRPGQRL